jgi:hypothetical protein
MRMVGVAFVMLTSQSYTRSTLHHCASILLALACSAGSYTVHLSHVVIGVSSGAPDIPVDTTAATAADPASEFAMPPPAMPPPVEEAVMETAYGVVHGHVTTYVKP